MTSEPAPARVAPGHSGRHGRRDEARLPAAVAVLVAAALYGLLPDSLLPAPRWVIPGLEVAFLIAVPTANPWRLTRDSRWSRLVSIALALVIIASNLVALGLLVADLTTGSVKHQGGLLVAGLQVWATDVIAFALLFWELDRGGPVSRTQLPRDRNRQHLGTRRDRHPCCRHTLGEGYPNRFLLGLGDHSLLWSSGL